MTWAEEERALFTRWQALTPEKRLEATAYLFGLIAGSSRRSLGITPTLLDLALRHTEAQPTDLVTRPLTVGAD